MAEKSVRIPKMKHKGRKRGQKQEGLIEKPMLWVRISFQPFVLKLLLMESLLAN
jgi:hypothetical protein